MQISIRRASPLDLLQMTKTYLDAFLGEDRVDKRVLEALSLCLRVSRGHCFVAEMNGVVVGMGCLFPFGTSGWVGCVAVKRAYQRRGIARK